MGDTWNQRMNRTPGPACLALRCTRAGSHLFTALVCNTFLIVRSACALLFIQRAIFPHYNTLHYPFHPISLRPPAPPTLGNIVLPNGIRHTTGHSVLHTTLISWFHPLYPKSQKHMAYSDQDAQNDIYK